MSANAYLAGGWEEISRHAVASLTKLVPEHAPVDALKEAKGILLTVQQDTGLLAGVLHKGSAMLVVQLEPTLGAQPYYSAPVFFNINSAGVGFALGSAETESITLLYSKAAVDELTGSRFDLKVTGVSHDSNYGSEPVSKQVEHQEPSAVKQIAKQVLDIDNDTDQVTSQRVYSEQFSVATGKIKDFSISAEFYKQSRESMRKLYGNDVSFQDVLTKGVLRQPEGLKGFYDALNALVGPVNQYNSGAVFKVTAM